MHPTFFQDQIQAHAVAVAVAHAVAVQAHAVDTSGLAAFKREIGKFTLTQIQDLRSISTNRHEPRETSDKARLPRWVQSIDDTVLP